MPTPLNNQASIRYNYSGAGTGTAVSNTVTTNLLDRYTLAATKTPLSSTFRPGENVTYVIRVENNGSGDLYNVTIADDLGGGADTPLVYNPASLRAYVDSIPVTISPVVQGGTLTAVLPAPLPAGTAAILVYTAQVRPDVDFTLQSITNTVAVTANGGSAAGPVLRLALNNGNRIMLPRLTAAESTRQGIAIHLMLTPAGPCGYAISTGGTIIGLNVADTLDYKEVPTVTLSLSDSASFGAGTWYGVYGIKM